MKAMQPQVTHYYDRHLERHVVKVLPGEYFATERDLAMVTLLGSCVSACLWDAKRGIGGMNHFMLPGAGDSARLGIYAMEVLINRMLRCGAERGSLVAKVFGGANVLEGMALNIGSQNAAFVLEFLREERIPVIAQDLQDLCPRKVAFFPASGRVLVKRLTAVRTDGLQRLERDYLSKLQRGRAGEVEIFRRRP
jgi:chemotaxis protein CheD